jgi:hypothetical protein
MAKKYPKRKPISFAEVSTKRHPFVGLVWPVASSRSSEKYSVEMHETGFTCDCIGFTMHGKCKHIAFVVSRVSDENYVRYR